MIQRYLNLTNGLEWREQYPEAKIVRIPSTSIEKNDWASIFLELDHDLIFNLAIGNTCVIYDCGCRRQVSKTIGVGVPVIGGCLNAFWHDSPAPEHYHGLFAYSPNCNLSDLVRIKRKYGYYRRFLSEGGRVDLRGISKATNKDGDLRFYRSLVGEAS